LDAIVRVREPFHLKQEGAMQVLSNGRVRRTEAEWRRIFAGHERSQLEAAAFCRKEGLRLSSFWRWHRKLNGADGAGAFVAVRTELPAPAPWTLEVTLPSGCTLRFQG
jgi:hypothetical protein